MFSKFNFICDINNDTILKIRNVSGQIVYLIKEATCTVSVHGNIINIKQSAESTTINLDFNSSIEAYDAHIILRDNLKILLNNQNAILPTVNINTINIVPPLTIIGISQSFNVNFIFNTIISLYVNGLLIDNSWYSYTKIPYVITWLGIAEYNLDPLTDIITIIYQ